MRLNVGGWKKVEYKPIQVAEKEVLREDFLAKKAREEQATAQTKTRC